MAFELPKLPYAMNALEPHISQETLEFHYGKHHQAYVNKLNGLIPGTEFEGMSLEDIIKKASGGVFNNAAQIWNHTFYWHSMSPDGGSEPTGKLADAINKNFGSFQAFKDKFTEAAGTHFGSGWAWLVNNGHGELEIMSTHDAGTPVKDGKHAMLTCDVWEHAYYIDVRNNRPQYIGNFWHVVNWEFVASNL